MASPRSTLQDCFDQFNSDPSKGLADFIHQGLVQSADPTTLAVFLFSHNGTVDPRSLGILFCSMESPGRDVFAAYLKLFSFSQLTLDEALRQLCQRVAVPYSREAVQLFLTALAETYFATQSLVPSTVSKLRFKHVPEIRQCLQLLLKWNALCHGKGRGRISKGETRQDIVTFITSYFEHLRRSQSHLRGVVQAIDEQVVHESDFQDMFIRVLDTPIEISSPKTSTLSSPRTGLSGGNTSQHTCQGWMKYRSKSYYKHVVKLSGWSSWKNFWVVLSDSVMYCYLDESPLSGLDRMFTLSSVRCSLADVEFGFKVSKLDGSPLHVVKFTSSDSPNASQPHAGGGGTQQSKCAEVQLCAFDESSFRLWYQAILGAVGEVHAAESSAPPKQADLVNSAQLLAHTGQPSVQLWMFHCDGHHSSKTKHYKRVYGALFLGDGVAEPRGLQSRLYLFSSEDAANKMFNDGQLTHAITHFDLDLATEVRVSNAKAVLSNSWFGVELQILGRTHVFATESAKLYTALFRVLSHVVQTEQDSVSQVSNDQGLRNIQKGSQPHVYRNADGYNLDKLQKDNRFVYQTPPGYEGQAYTTRAAHIGGSRDALETQRRPGIHNANQFDRQLRLQKPTDQQQLTRKMHNKFESHAQAGREHLGTIHQHFSPPVYGSSQSQNVPQDSFSAHSSQHQSALSSLRNSGQNSPSQVEHQNQFPSEELVTNLRARRPSDMTPTNSLTTDPALSNLVRQRHQATTSQPGQFQGASWQPPDVKYRESSFGQQDRVMNERGIPEAQMRLLEMNLSRQTSQGANALPPSGRKSGSQPRPPPGPPPPL